MPQRQEDYRMMDQPFWRVMAFVVTGLVAIAVWVMKVNIEKLEKVSDSQIETKTMLKVLLDNNENTQTTLKEIQKDVNQLKLSDRSQEERLEAMTGRRYRATRTEAQ